MLLSVAVAITVLLSVSVIAAVFSVSIVIAVFPLFHVQAVDYGTQVGELVAQAEIFEQGSASPDGKAMDDLCYFISQADKGTGVGEHLINRWAMERMPIQTSTRALEMLEKSGRIRCVRIDGKTGVRYFKIAS